MKKKGFTLIELLAVIVILAIIALIATPIVMNVIENSRKGAAERSAENYMDAVETAVATARLDGTILEGEYTIKSDGNLCKAGTTCTEDTDIDIDMSGNKPIGGTIFIDNGLVINKSIMKTGDDYKVSYDLSKERYIAMKLAKLSDICEYNNSGREGEVGSLYLCDLGSSDSAKDLKFYVLEKNVSSNEITLIYEKNYDNTTQAWCVEGEINSCAADGLNNKLVEIKSVWNVEGMTIGIPSAEQIATADGKTFDNDYLSLTNSWLVNYPSDFGGMGYWTSTEDSNDTKEVYAVFTWSTCLDSGFVYANDSSSFGVRPIITLNLN